MKDTDCHLLLLQKPSPHFRPLKQERTFYVLFHERIILRLFHFHRDEQPRVWILICWRLRVYTYQLYWNSYLLIITLILYILLYKYNCCISLFLYLENICKLCGWIVRFNASNLWQGLMWTFVLWNPLWLDGDLRFQLPWTMVINYGGTVDYPN